MDDSVYSNVILDPGSGIFRLELFLNAFIECARREPQWRYPTHAQQCLVAKFNQYVRALQLRQSLLTATQHTTPPPGASGVLPQRGTAASYTVNAGTVSGPPNNRGAVPSTSHFTRSLPTASGACPSPPPPPPASREYGRSALGMPEPDYGSASAPGARAYSVNGVGNARSEPLVGGRCRPGPDGSGYGAGDLGGAGDVCGGGKRFRRSSSSESPGARRKTLATAPWVVAGAVNDGRVPLASVGTAMPPVSLAVSIRTAQDQFQASRSSDRGSGPSGGGLAPSASCAAAAPHDGSYQSCAAPWTLAPSARESAEASGEAAAVLSAAGLSRAGGAGRGGAGSSRLKLVLDLDNTLLHACSQAKLGQVDIRLDDFVDIDSGGAPELYRFRLPQLPHQTYYVKLRPGVRRFIREVSQFYDLAIHTNATREYADVVVAILDPDRSIFADRVAARQDENGRDLKKDIDRLFGCGDTDPRSFLILDDRKDVWDESFQGNIIHCGLYDYLESRRKQLIALYSTAAPASSAAPQASAASQSTAVPSGDINRRATGDASGPEATRNAVLVGDDLLQDAEAKVENEPRTGQADGSELGGQNSSDGAESPFLDNPMVEADGAASFLPLADCEDDDVIVGGSATASGNASSTSASSNGRTSVVPGEHEVARISEVAEALVDYDTQLDAVRELAVSLAQDYYSAKNQDEAVDITKLLANRRRKILAGVVVQTVGMYKSESSHPEFGWHDNGPMHRRRLTALGATVVEQPTPDLTHLLAMRATQTIDRVRAARGSSASYVHALWLHSCETSWSRVPEEYFEAFTLLKHYNFNPPRKPWLDHWRFAALGRGNCLGRIRHAEQTFQLAAVEAGVGVAQVPQSDDQAEKSDGRNTEGNGEAGSMAAITNPKSSLRPPPPTTFHFREHLVAHRQSHGARVWSSQEEIFLRFEPLAPIGTPDGASVNEPSWGQRLPGVAPVGGGTGGARFQNLPSNADAVWEATTTQGRPPTDGGRQPNKRTRSEQRPGENFFNLHGSNASEKRNASFVLPQRRSEAALSLSAPPIVESYDDGDYRGRTGLESRGQFPFMLSPSPPSVGGVAVAAAAAATASSAFL